MIYNLSNPHTIKHEHYFRWAPPCWIFLDRSWKIGHFQIKLEVIRTQIKLLGTRFSERFIIQLLQDISIIFFLINFIHQFWKFPTTEFTNYRKLIGIVLTRIIQSLYYSPASRWFIEVFLQFLKIDLEVFSR